MRREAGGTVPCSAAALGGRIGSAAAFEVLGGRSCAPVLPDGRAPCTGERLRAAAAPGGRAPGTGGPRGLPADRTPAGLGGRVPCMAAAAP